MMKNGFRVLGLCMFVLMASGVSGCGKDKDAEKKAPEVKWPDKPENGAPVATEFVSLEGSGEDLAAKIRFFNFSDKSVKRVGMLLEYLDADGKKLKDFPWAQMGTKYMLGPKEHKEYTMGAFMPPETKKVQVIIRSVDFDDGTDWKLPE